MPLFPRDRIARAISIHAPREGCDTASGADINAFFEFQSTHPARGATKSAKRNGTVGMISIHAPREGCDNLRVTLL